MPLTPNSTIPAGKANLMASFNTWLMNTIQGGYFGLPPLPTGKEFFWNFDAPIAAQKTPGISTTEVGLFNLGETALERLLGHDANGNPIFGIRNQTLIEISCIDQDSETYTSATQKVRKLRDRVVNALYVETIPLRNYDDPLTPQIGIIELDSASNAINEKFLIDPANQNLKRYVLLVRVFWMEFINRTQLQTINANAQIV